MDCDEDLQNEDYYKHKIEEIVQIKLLRKELKDEKG